MPNIYKTSKDSIVRHAGVTFAGVILGALLVFLNEVLAARFLGLRFYGFFALAFILAKVGEIVSTFGLQLGVIRFIPRYRVEGRSDEVAGSILGALIMPAFAGAILTAAVWYGSDWLASFVFSEPASGIYIRYMAFAIPFLSIVNILGHVTRAYGRSVEQVLIRNLVPPFLFSVFLMLAFLVETSPLFVLIGFVCSYALGTVIGGGLVARLVRLDGNVVRPKLHLRQLYSYSSYVFLNSALLLAMGLTDIFMLGVFKTAEDVGIYRACLQIVHVFDLIAFALGAATMPLYPLIIKEGNRKKLQEVYGTALRLASFIVIPAFLIIALNAADILALLGASFTVGATALSIRAFGAAIKVYFSGAGFLLLVGDKQKLETANASIAVVVNIVLNFLLIPQYGIEGAALATMTTLLFLSGLRAIEVRITLNLASVWLVLLRYVAVCGIAALIITYGASWLSLEPGSGALALLLRVTILGIVIMASLWIFGIDKENKASMLRAVRGARSQAG